MDAEKLEDEGLFMDELSKVRVLDPEVQHQGISMNDECNFFESTTTDFRKCVEVFAKTLKSLSIEVEEQKQKAIGSRNQLKSCSKEREAQQQQLQALIMERRLLLERLKMQYEGLRKKDADQSELIELFLLQK